MVTAVDAGIEKRFIQYFLPCENNRASKNQALLSAAAEYLTISSFRSPLFQIINLRSVQFCFFTDLRCILLRHSIVINGIRIFSVKYLSEQLRQIKQALNSEIANPGSEAAEILKSRKKLLSWLKNTPVYLKLQWFDAVEEVRVSAKLLSRR